MPDKKICPECGAENKGMDLDETQGIYICYNCRKVIDAKTDMIVDEDKIESDKD